MSVILGADPGLTTGLAVLDLERRTWELAQLSPLLVMPLIGALIERYDVVGIACERFVVGPRASRSATPRGGQVARELEAQIDAVADPGLRVHPIKVIRRSASQVKPWATAERLKAAGIATRGMPHALDAARHALYAAVRDFGFPDPLSSAFAPPR